jgi:hypothetical protein
MDIVALPAAATTEAATGSGTTEAAKKRIHNREIEAKGARGFLKKFFDKFVTKTVFKKIICPGSPGLGGGGGGRWRQLAARSRSSQQLLSCFLLLLRDQVKGERGRRAGWARSASRRVAV